MALDVLDDYFELNGMKIIAQFTKGILILIIIIGLSSCFEPAPVQIKPQNKISASNSSQTIPKCCSNKPSRFASRLTPMKMNK